MSHPHHEHRAHKHEKSRVAHITKGYASGGAVHDDEAEDRKEIASAVHKHEKHLHKGEKETKLATGGRAHHRADRPHRAKGGRVKGKNKGTVVNINVAPQSQAPQHVPVPVPVHGGPPPGGPPPGMPPGAPPVAPHPPMMPPGAGGPSGMPPGMPMRARGGGIKSGPTYLEGIRNGTQVQHTDGKNDGKDIGRKKPVTYSKGGAADLDTAGTSEQQRNASNNAYKAHEVTRDKMGPPLRGDFGPRNQPGRNAGSDSYATGGPVEHPVHGGMAPKLPSGSGGARARLAKERMASKHYRKAG